MEFEISQLRHLYANLVNGGVKDSAAAKRIAEGLLAPVIESLESSPKHISLCSDQIKALEDARNTAMEFTLRARVPECGEFGRIAQGLDWLLDTIIKDRPKQLEATQDAAPLSTLKELAVLDFGVSVSSEDDEWSIEQTAKTVRDYIA
jgi:hypothetical protein